MKRSTLVLLGFTGICGVVVSATAGSVVANPSGGALPPALTLVVSGADAGVPDDAVGLALNVTVTNPMAAGFVTVYPCDQPKPATSNLNYVKDQTVPNMVITAVDGNGYACIDTLAVADVVVDVAGYVPADSGLTMLASPQRFLDTRDGLGAPKSRVKGGTELKVPVAGGHGVPADAGAVVFNATAVNAAAGGFLAVYPCGQPTPVTSTLNFAAGGVVPNLVTSALGPSGDVCFFANVDVDIVGDVAGYFAGATAGVTLLSKPERIVDSRDGTGGPQAKVTLAPRAVQVTGVAGVPAGASAALVNLTATNGVAPGWLAAYPCDTAPPEVSNLNFNKNQNVANAAVVKLAADGTFCVRANQAVDLVVDVTGYTTGTQWIVPLPPKRVHDTRNDATPECNLAVVKHGDGSRSWVDLSTGAIRNPLPIASDALVSAMMIDSDCQHLEVLGWTSQVNPDTTLSVYGIQGGAETYILDSDYQYVLSDLGLVAYDHNVGIVFLYDSGQPLFQVPDPSRLGFTSSWHFDGVSQDGSSFFFIASDGNHSPREFVFNIYGQVVGEVPRRSSAISLAPDGNYLLSYESGCPVVSPDADCRTGLRLVVQTLDGTIVDSIVGPRLGLFPPDPSPYWMSGKWTSSGTLLITGVAGNNCVFALWELFNTAKLLPAGVNPSCETFETVR